MSDLAKRLLELKSLYEELAVKRRTPVDSYVLRHVAGRLINTDSF